MTTMTTEHAQIPNAVQAFQRQLAAALRYWWPVRIADWWAGRRDRGFPVVFEVDTPWLNALSHLFANRIELERRNTLAVIAVLDDQIAQLAGSVEAARDELDEVDDETGRLEAAPVTDAPTTQVEAGDAPEHRLARRRRALQAAQGKLTARRRAASEAVKKANAEIARLDAARQSHWTLLLSRSFHLLELGNRRAATYTRSLLRGDDRPLSTPTLRAPEWLGQPDVPNRVSASFPEPAPVSPLHAV